MSSEVKRIALWPREVLGPPPGMKEICVICWSILIFGILMPGIVALVVQARNGNLFFEKGPVDFVYLYGVGKIANTHSAIDVYDYGLQLKTFQSIISIRPEDGTYGPSPYPPFVSQFFRIFAHLDFAHAYFAWAGVSLLLYLSGIRLLLKEFSLGDRFRDSLVMCFALGSHAFLMNTLGNGQLSAVALFFEALAITLERRSKPFLSGLALSVVLYKFTLLPLIVMMLVLTRRFKTLAGFTSGVSFLALLTTLFAGLRIWPVYVHFILDFGKIAGAYGKTSERLWKFVDLNSFSYPGIGGRPFYAVVLLAAAIIIAVATLAILLWRTDRSSRPQQSLAWAATITWTMLVNVYYPSYDVILLVIPTVLTLSAATELGWGRAFRWMVALGVSVVVLSWIHEPFYLRYGVQLMTLGLIAVAVLQMNLLRRAIKERALQPETTAASI
jgi:hypothetical protein